MANFTDGTYYVNFKGQQGFCEAKTGTPQFFLKFDVTHRSKDGGWVEVEQSERTWYQALTMETQAMFIDKIRAMGFQGSRMTLLDPETSGAHIFSGGAEFICKSETYDGKARERWTPAAGGAAAHVEKKLDAAKLSKLDLMFGAALKSGAAAPPRQTPAASTAPASTTGEANVPY